MGYKFIKADDHSYTLKHPDGSDFRIAKHTLAEAVHQHISSLPRMADGGEVQPQDITDNPSEMLGNPADISADVAPPPEANPNEQAFQTRFKQRLAQKGALYGGTEQVPESAKRDAEAEALQDVSQSNKQSQLRAQQTQQVQAQKSSNIDLLRSQLGLPPSPSSPQGQQTLSDSNPNIVPKEQQIGAPEQPADSAPQSLQSEYEKAFGAQAQGIIGGAAAQTELGAKQANIYGQEQAKLAQAKAATDAKLKELTDQTDILYKGLVTEKVDPNRYWNSQSTGNKILSAISLVLGGIAGQGNGNVGLDIINKAIERDIDAQKADISNKHSLFNMNLARTRNVQEAYQLTQSQLLTVASAQLAQAGAQSQGPEAQAKAQMLLGQLGQQVAGMHQQLALFNAKQQLIGGGAPVNPELLGKEDRERLVQMPGGKQALALTTKSAETVREQLSTVQPIYEGLDKLDALGPSALIPGSVAYNKAQALRSTLIPLINENAGLKRLSEEDIRNITQQLRDPTSFRQIIGGKERSQVLRDLLDDKLKTSLSQHLEGYQVKPKVGVPYKGSH